MANPIAFMVMPFNPKPTGIVAPDVPAEVDFDALWENVYSPVLSEMGYTPVRADQDVGALIIAEMIQRLTLADLVVADVTLPNANVYYEIGVRHAAKKVGCVLVAADWAKPVFDLAQIRQLRFPLPDGKVGPEAAKAASAPLAKGLAALTEGTSPVFDSVPGYPSDDIDLSRLSAFRDAVADLSSFDTDVKAVRLRPGSQRRAAAMTVLEKHGRKPVIRQTVVLSMIRLLRDNVGWGEMLEYIDALPTTVARHPLVLEQRALALGKTGDPAAAAAELEELILRDGQTSERLGLLGGRYKELYGQAETQAERLRYLDDAIKSYEQGMMANLHDYYPSSNLPRLYRARAGDRDEERAHEAEVITAVACRRAVALGMADEWARPTLLGLAFDRGHAAEARELLAEVVREGTETWKLDSMIKDLVKSAANHADPETRSQLQGVVAALQGLLAPAPVPG